MGKLYSSHGQYTDNVTVERVLAATRDAIGGAMAVTKFQSALHPGVEHYRQAREALETLRDQADLYNRNYPLEDEVVNKLERYLHDDLIRSQAPDAVGWQNTLREALEAWADLEEAREDNSRCQHCGQIGGH